jgi:hypothetical protein
MMAMGHRTSYSDSVSQVNYWLLTCCHKTRYLQVRLAYGVGIQRS